MQYRVHRECHLEGRPVRVGAIVTTIRPAPPALVESGCLSPVGPVAPLAGTFRPGPGTAPLAGPDRSDSRDGPELDAIRRRLSAAGRNTRRRD